MCHVAIQLTPFGYYSFAQPYSFFFLHGIKVRQQLSLENCQLWQLLSAAVVDSCQLLHLATRKKAVIAGEKCVYLTFYVYQFIFKYCTYLRPSQAGGLKKVIKVCCPFTACSLPGQLKTLTEWRWDVKNCKHTIGGVSTEPQTSFSH